MKLRLKPGAMDGLTPGERAQVAALLEEAQAAVARNPLENYSPVTRKHHRLHLRRAPVRIVKGGNRSGKTTWGIVDSAIQMTPKELLPERLRKYKHNEECGFYCRIITPDMERTMKPVIWQKLEEWLPRDLLRKGTVLDSIDKAAMCLRLTCGCRFDFLSYEMDFNKFGGAALHRVMYDEEPPKDIREECLWRLVDYNGDEIFTMTPLKGTSLLIRKLEKQAKTSENVVTETISMLDNHHLSQEARDRVVEMAKDDPRFRSRVYGEVHDIGGPVYPQWEDTLIPTIPWRDLRQMEHVVSLDPGIRYAGVVYQAFDDDSNRAHTYRAVKLYGADAEQYAREMRMSLARMGLDEDSPNVHFVVDPNAVARSAVDGRNVLDELGDLGFGMARGNNAVEAGVLHQRRRDRLGWSTIANDDDTEDLRDELESYVLEVDEAKDDGEFKVRKQDDHVCDARRYGVMERAWWPEGMEVDQPETEPIAWWERADGPKPKRVDPHHY